MRRFKTIMKGLGALALLFVMLSSDSSAIAAQSALSLLYSRARDNFKASQDLTQKEAKTSGLRNCILELQEVMKQDTEGKLKDRCLYLIARSHHILYETSKTKEDFESALELYRSVVQGFPNSYLADDCQYLIGLLLMNDDPRQAYLEFAKVGVFFPKGDKRQKAAQKAAELEKQLGCQRAKKTDSPPSSPPAFSASVSPSPSSPTASGSAAPSTPHEANAASPSTTQGSSTMCPSLNELLRIQHWSGEEYTRVVLYTTSPVKFEEQVASADPKAKQPGKVSLVLQNCIVNPKMQSQTHVDDPFLKEINVTQQDITHARVLLDLDSIDAYRVFTLADPFRLIVDVRGVKPQQTSTLQKAATREGTVSVGSPAKTALRTPVPKQKTKDKNTALPSLARQLGLDVKRIVLDPGHGGKDKGAISSSNVYEKDIVLSIAKELQKILVTKTGCDVILTRTRDRYLSLEERTAIANAQKADLFVSIHTNAHEDRSLHGIETYFLNLSKDKESARVAALENATSTKKISDLEAILHDLMLNTKINESRHLATEVQSSLVTKLKGNYEGIRDLGTKQAPFYVLIGAEMPSILIEAAFITNEVEENRLKDKRFQENLSKAIAAGIESYIQRMKNFAKAGN